MHVTLRQLKAFEAAARLGSITRAAGELHLSQPTVSIQLKQLSDSIGSPLFEMRGKRMVLTETGRALAITCREMFDALDRFEMTVADLKGLKRGRLRLAAVSTAKYFIPRVLGPFLTRHPGIEVALEVANRDRVLERLADHLDDLYVMTRPPEDPGLTATPFLDNPLVVIAPLAHALAGRGRVTLARLGEERFIMRESGSGTRLVAEEFLAARGIQPDVRMEIATNEAVKQAVAGGLGVAVVSSHALHPDPALEGLAVLNVQGFPLESGWQLVYSSEHQLSVVAGAFLDYLREDATRALLEPGFHPVPRKP